MTIDIPDWLKPVAWAAGTQWPEADEDALRRMGAAWTKAASDLGPAGDTGNDAARQVLQSVTGQTHDAFAEYWKQFSGTDGSFIPELRKMLESVGEECASCALEVEYTKMTVIAALAFLAAQIAVLLANSIETFGASTAGIPIAQLATRTAVWAMIRQLLSKIAAKGASTIVREIGVSLAKNLVANVGTDAAIQGAQITRGDRHQWDTDKTTGAVISAGTGAVTDVGGAHTVGRVAGRFDTAGLNTAVNAGGGALAGGLGGAADSALHGNVDAAHLIAGARGGSTAGALGGGTASAKHSAADRAPVAEPRTRATYNGPDQHGRHRPEVVSAPRHRAETVPIGPLPNNPSSVIVQDGERPGETEPGQEQPGALPKPPLLNLPPN